MAQEGEAVRVREYGSTGPCVILLHGGPGAPGHMAPVARGLADRFRVLEPFQRGHGGEPLRVAQHVADLHELVAALPESERPALVGSSWGAMLALAYAAAHPTSAGPLVLIGCGTFDEASRDQYRRTLEERMNEPLRQRLGVQPGRFPDADRRLAELARLLLPLYSVDLICDDLELAECDARAHRETWEDMLRLQKSGKYPAAFQVIRQPVLMLHGENDPHPGSSIRRSLQPHLPQLEFESWEECGHYPWLERAVADRFFAVLKTWLSEKCE